MRVMRAKPLCKGCRYTTLVLLSILIVVVEEYKEEAKSNIDQAQR